ncbi:hypothetical protein [Idiomarina sp. UBA1919]|uniref:hypothetical protein n=1 Tax=Idiomarina sp. UBA1919 TaxID=1946640 RepID=UPI00257AA843|nr:hypothetical protein [Idiomarina sp. UBA1919]
MYKIVSAVFVTLWIGYSLFIDDGCALDRDQAYEKVSTYLERKGLPLRYLLSEPKEKDVCQFSFYYKGEGEHMHFVVLDDFLRGPKLTKWNYNEHEE